MSRGKAKSSFLQNMFLFMDWGSYKNILTNEVPPKTLFIKLKIPSGEVARGGSSTQILLLIKTPVPPFC